MGGNSKDIQVRKELPGKDPACAKAQGQERVLAASLESSLLPLPLHRDPRRALCLQESPGALAAGGSLSRMKPSLPRPPPDCRKGRGRFREGGGRGSGVRSWAWLPLWLGTTASMEWLWAAAKLRHSDLCQVGPLSPSRELPGERAWGHLSQEELGLLSGESVSDMGGL